jgi:hypothetical protein
MHTHADKILEKTSQSMANPVTQKQICGESTFQLVDNRPETIAQGKLQDMANNSPSVMQLKAIPDMVNNIQLAQQAAQLQIMASEHKSQHLPLT